MKKARPRQVSFLTLSACCTLCQVIFTPSKLEAAWCAVKNTIKLNYSGARNFPPPICQAFCISFQSKEKSPSDPSGRGKNIKPPQQVCWMALHLSSPCWGAQPPCQAPGFPPAHLPGVVPLCPQCQVVSDKIIFSRAAAE